MIKRALIKDEQRIKPRKRTFRSGYIRVGAESIENRCGSERTGQREREIRRESDESRAVAGVGVDLIAPEVRSPQTSDSPPFFQNVGKRPAIESSFDLTHCRYALHDVDAGLVDPMGEGLIVVERDYIKLATASAVAVDDLAGPYSETAWEALAQQFADTSLDRVATQPTVLELLSRAIQRGTKD